MGEIYRAVSLQKVLKLVPTVNGVTTFIERHSTRTYIMIIITSVVFPVKVDWESSYLIGRKQDGSIILIRMIISSFVKVGGG
jgi:hypothetical protein